MKPTEHLNKIFAGIRIGQFPSHNFDKSCLMYSKSSYGIFLVTGKNGETYTVKVSVDELGRGGEVDIAFYIKKRLNNMPNLLLPENVYVGANPINFPLFTNEKNRLKLPQCKDAPLNKIFIIEFPHTYYVTKACLYNLGYYLGVHKGTLSYKAFVAFSFQILFALQSLHSIGVWHRDIKTQNILICNSDIAKKYDKISYTVENTVWTVDYKDTDKRDMKIIDYGESFVIDEVNTPCQEFKFEVTVAAVTVLSVMWNKVLDKQGDIDSLLALLKNCQTSITDVIMVAPIYESLKYEDNTSFKVYI